MIRGLEEHRYPSGSFQLDRQPGLDPRCIARTDSPAQKELVGGTKVEAAVGSWVQSKLSLKGRTEVCATYVFPLILCRLVIRPLPANYVKSLHYQLSSLLWDKGRHCVHRQVCVQHSCEGGLGLPNLRCYQDAERMAFLSQTLTEKSAWNPIVEGTFHNLILKHLVDADHSS